MIVKNKDEMITQTPKFLRATKKTRQIHFLYFGVLLRKKRKESRVIRERKNCFRHSSMYTKLVRDKTTVVHTVIVQ